MLKFRKKTLLSYFGLDPAQIYTTPNYSWYAMLKYTKIVLELMTDIEMYDMIKTILGLVYVQLVQSDMLKQITHI